MMLALGGTAGAAILAHGGTAGAAILAHGGTAGAAILAHGGTAGAVAEAAFILVPMAVFAWLARVSKKRREAEEVEDGDAGTGSTVP